MAPGPALPTLPAEPDPPAPAGIGSGRQPLIDTGRCTGCGRCVAVCQPHLLSLDVVHWRKFATLHDAPRCTGCSLCAVVCPFHAIGMRRPTDRGAKAASDCRQGHGPGSDPGLTT